MTCHRCGALSRLVTTETQEGVLEWFRCDSCGCYTDDVSRQNRVAPPMPIGAHHRGAYAEKGRGSR